MLRTLIAPEEFKNDQMLSEKLQSWENSGLQLILLPCDTDTMKEIVPSETLWIVTSEEQWAFGKSFGIAMLPYLEEAEFDAHLAGSFSEAETIVTGFEEVELSFLDRVYRRWHNLPWIIAEQEHFILREFTMEDMDGLFELYDDATLFPFVEPLYAREKERVYEETYIANMYRFYGYGMWLVIDPETGGIIGRAGLEHRDYDGETELEMGYLIHRDYRGKGLAYEVCRAVLNFACEELDFERVNCLIHAENTASVHLALKLGFTYHSDVLENGHVMKRFVKKLR